MAIFATLIIWAAYERSVNHLYAIPDGKVWALVDLTQTFLHAVAAIAATLVGIMGLVTMTSRTSSSVEAKVQETIARQVRPRDYDEHDEPPVP